MSLPAGEKFQQLVLLLGPERKDVLVDDLLLFIEHQNLRVRSDQAIKEMALIQEDFKSQIVGFDKTLHLLSDDPVKGAGSPFRGPAPVYQYSADALFADGPRKGSAELQQRSETGRAKHAVEIDQDPALSLSAEHGRGA